MKTLNCCAAFALTLLPAVGTAQNFDVGTDAYEAGDYAAALREWTPLAEQGYAPAQNNLGKIYAYGRGVPQNDAQAVRWY